MIRSSRKSTTKPKSKPIVNSVDLEEAARSFEKEFIADEAREPNELERAEWNKAKRKRGRPAVGDGSRTISVSVEKRLLKDADRLAKRLSISRAKLIACGLKKMLGTQ